MNNHYFDTRRWNPIIYISINIVVLEAAKINILLLWMQQPDESPWKGQLNVIIPSISPGYSGVKNVHQVLKGQVINKVTRLEDAIYATISVETLLPATLNVSRNNITFWNIFLWCRVGKRNAMIQHHLFLRVSLMIFIPFEWKWVIRTTKTRGYKTLWVRLTRICFPMANGASAQPRPTMWWRHWICLMLMICEG